MGEGFLTVKIDETTTFDRSDFRQQHPIRSARLGRKANQALVDVLRSVAGWKKATSAKFALAWLLAQKPWIVPISLTQSLERLDEYIGAVAAELTSDDLRDIESAAQRSPSPGARYPREVERWTNR